MQLEIIGTDGTVHYTRPHDHPDVWEALNTPGYSVRGTGEKRASGSLHPACCAAPCVSYTVQTADKATCVYLRDGTKVTVERDATTKGPAWLKVSQQARITTARHNK